jgi:hypothetical protein
VNETTPIGTARAWPEWVYPYRAGLVGGLIGGAAMALVVGFDSVITGKGWQLANTVAATANPSMVAEAPWLPVGIAHLVFGLVLGWWIDRTPPIYVER